MTRDAVVEEVAVAVYTIPTDGPEADGTLAWTETTMVAVHARAGGETGFGYSYADPAAARIVEKHLADVVRGRSAMDVPAAWQAMGRAVRNLSRSGLASYAIAAVDVALWDLKARLLGVSLAHLLGREREGAALYGSGGFTSASIDELQRQLAGWTAAGVGAVKMKVGTDPAADPSRVAAAREAIGNGPELMIDANGAFSAGRALALAARVADAGVTWFEEPVSSDDERGLAHVRGRLPRGIEVSAGEYATDAYAFRRLLEAGAVDVLQADATRCGGYTGFRIAAGLAFAHNVPLSTHTAPALHLPAALAAPGLRHIEWFHDHVRIEAMLLDGAQEPHDGELRSDAAAPGHGLSLRAGEARRFAA